MILILTDTVTSRLQYICEFIFKENFGVEFSFSTDQCDFGLSSFPRINYTRARFGKDVLNIKPQGLLFEKNIVQNYEVEMFDLNGSPAFFKNEMHPGDFEFDIFSAIFFLISRYEEYGPHTVDEYGRYDHRQSAAFRNGFLKIPLINRWLQHFAAFLQQKFPEMKIRNSVFSFLPTFDVDIAFEWRHKGLIKNAARFAKLLLKQDYEKISEGFRILSGKKEDAFNSFDLINELNEKYKLSPVYFFLVAKKSTSHDKNIRPCVKEMQHLIKAHSEKYDVGIHPSFYTPDDELILKKEKFLLEEIIGKVIRKSRQHYLRFNLPQTYRVLSGAGITDEYSMGYGSVNGFRASYAGTFFWYDLDREERTNLRIHPFCYMDSNSIFHEKLTPGEAFSEITALYSECSNVNGKFISVFHNHLMSSHDPEWSDVYNKFLNQTRGEETNV